MPVEAGVGGQRACHLAGNGTGFGLPQVDSCALTPSSTWAGMRPPPVRDGRGKRPCGSLVAIPLWLRQPPCVIHFECRSPRTAMSTAHSTWFGVGWSAWEFTSLRGTEHQRSVSTGSFALLSAAVRAAGAAGAAIPVREGDTEVSPLSAVVCTTPRLRRCSRSRAAQTCPNSPALYGSP